MDIKYSRDSIKFLGKLEKKSVERIRESISKLLLNPPQGDIAPMQGYSDGRKRLRVGGWRIIFRHDKLDQIEILHIIDINNRGDIYK